MICGSSAPHAGSYVPGTSAQAAAPPAAHNSHDMPPPPPRDNQRELRGGGGSPQAWQDRRPPPPSQASERSWRGDQGVEPRRGGPPPWDRPTSPGGYSSGLDSPPPPPPPPRKPGEGGLQGSDGSMRTIPARALVGGDFPPPPPPPPRGSGLSGTAAGAGFGQRPPQDRSESWSQQQGPYGQGSHHDGRRPAQPDARGEGPYGQGPSRGDGPHGAPPRGEPPLGQVLHRGEPTRGGSGPSPSGQQGYQREASGQGPPRGEPPYGHGPPHGHGSPQGYAPQPQHGRGRTHPLQNEWLSGDGREGGLSGLLGALDLGHWVTCMKASGPWSDGGDEIQVPSQPPKHVAVPT